MESRTPGASAKNSTKPPLNRSLSNTDVNTYDKNDGSMSDSAVGTSVTEGECVF